MKCINCNNAGKCIDHNEYPGLIGCTSGIPYRKAKTNADRIRSMSDEELADLLDEVFNNIADFPCSSCAEKINCDVCFLEWLQQEAEE